MTAKQITINDSEANDNYSTNKQFNKKSEDQKTVNKEQLSVNVRTLQKNKARDKTQDPNQKMLIDP